MNNDQEEKKLDEEVVETPEADISEAAKTTENVETAEETETPIENLSPENLAREETIANFGYDDTNMQDEKTEFGLLRPRILEQEMQESYLDYAMSVIVSRALPDVRDGLKPVHRRVLYSMHELGLASRAKYRKSATVVGDVLGKYHPHGDVAVYDSLVRMAQDFSMRQPLVDGQGNFGSMDGDTAAAMRYTECRMTAISEEMLADIEKDTVPFSPNYDGSRTEPRVLPSKVPNLLLNGAMGIAVGMATNIPPHNLGELIDGTIHLIDNPECLVEDLMQFVKGPDFPTGAEIYGLNQIRNAYTTGRGSIVMRAVTNIEELKKGGYRIIVSKLPYQVNKAELISKIAELVKDKKIEGISGLRDESDRTDGVRIVIDLKSTAFPKKILNRLYELTLLQTSFHVNMLALVDGIQPRILTLKNVLDEYIKHRRVVVRRRTEFELARAKERAHILEGLRIALQNIDAVIKTIRESKNREEAHKALCERFKLSDIQSTAILDMRLSALAALEQQRVEDEYQEKLKLIAELEAILASEKRISEIIKKELKETRAKFATERRTIIYEQEIGKFKAEDLIPAEDVIVMLTKTNYIKRLPVSTYRSQIRGGRGVMGMETKEEDTIEHLVSANTHDDILFFTDRGRVFQTKVYELPASSRISKGQAIVNILQISPEEKVTAMITVSSKDQAKDKFFVMATTKGVVKKSDIELYKNVRKTGIVAMKLNPGDKLCWVKTTSGEDKIFMSSAKGQSIFYREQDIRPMGRSAAGVRGIQLRSDDNVVDVDVVSLEKESLAFVLTVMQNGLGKRTPLKQFKPQLRGGMGIRVANVTDRTGKVVASRVVFGDELDVILATKLGQMIRMPAETIKILGRDTQGVTLVKLKDPDKVASVTVVAQAEEIEDDKNQPSLPLEDIKENKKGDVKELEETREKGEEEMSDENQNEDEKEIPEWAKVHVGLDDEPEVKEIEPNKEEPNWWGGDAKK